MRKALIAVAAAAILAGCGGKGDAAGGGEAADPAKAGPEDYGRKVWTTEAIENLGALGAAARNFYEIERASRSGEILPRSFPPTVGWTPPLGSCCKKADRTCDPDPALWTAETWKGLSFAPAEPLRYSYRFLSSGGGASAGFTVQASGDLDCNGVFSTFERTGKAGPGGEVSLSDLTKTNELE